jgi:gliding motility-associated-like protein
MIRSTLLTLRTQITLLIVIFSLSNKSFAQKGKDGAETVATAGAIFNRYTTLAQTAAVGTNTIAVGNIADLASTAIAGAANNPYATAIITSCDLLMIIKMQGVTINTTNTTAYGTITNYNGVGDYEFVEVGSVNGNTITLANGCSILKGYNVSTTERVQVIRVPRLSSLTVNAGASLTARLWGNVAGTGGVVVVENNGATVVNGSITSAGQGFRGGQLDNNTNYGGTNFVSTTDDLGGEKGESIAGFQTDYDALGGRYGKGAPANGGGGGNDHNNGGGGGANGDNGVAYNGNGIPSLAVPGWAAAWNLEAAGFSTNTSSGGGRGGYSFASTNLNALTTAPGNAGWGGDNRRNEGGKGGRPLNTSGNTRLFLGGGGGAGDGNNNANQVGASGGGIVFLISDGNVSGSGSINSNGNAAANTVSGHNDAPGGGGGGGSAVILSGGTITGISVTANGGKGGDQLITNDESEGPGGSGGGGYILTTTTAVSRLVNSAATGTTSSSAVTEFIPNGATSGATGLIVNNIPFVTTPTLVDLALNASGNAAPFCQNGLKTYTVVVTNTSNCNAASNLTINIPTPAGLSFTANTASTGGFTSPSWTLATLAAGASATLTLNASVTGTNIAAFNATASATQLECATANNTVSLASSTVIVVNTGGTASPGSICAGGTATLTGTGATTYNWNPGGLTGTSVTVAPAGSTTYTVTGTTSGCSTTATVNLTVISNPTVNASASPTAICAGGTATLTGTGATTYNWNPGGLSGTSVTVSPAGTTIYTVTGTTSGCIGTRTLNLVVNASPTVNALASPTSVCSGVAGTLTATGATSYTWNPGGSTGATINPTIAATTIFTVTGTNAIGCTNTRTVSLVLNNCPTAVADATTTTVNSPVSGNLSTNDINAAGGTYSIGQPNAGTGTLTVNPANGQYTYTPATGFTGTTQATYTLCNGSPVVCSSTSITFTVTGLAPTAVNNTITTMQNTPVVANAGSNDINNVGATFSVGVPSGGAGVITMNPSNGQYTFTPTAGFTGTTQVTYTLCNGFPLVCSSAIISITVTPSVALFTSTCLASVTALNNYSTFATPGGTGLNNTTRATSLPGVNITHSSSIASPGANFAVYSFTAGAVNFDNSIEVAANSNVTPVNYTLTFNQPIQNLIHDAWDVEELTGLTAFSGTTLINPSSFTLGANIITAGNTYSSNIPGAEDNVNNRVTLAYAQAIDKIVITKIGTGLFSQHFLMGGCVQLPTASPDATVTMQNTAVSGNASTNDSGAGLSPTFTNGQPTAGTGTLTMSPSSGQYTYTPATGFTGTTQATYTLCNLNSPPCSTTTITFTVFPTLAANPNTVVTTPSVSTSGNLLTNDNGIVAGGVYTTSITQPAATTGTFVLSPATGQYTFNPNPAFTGTASTTYTVCNTAVTPSVCSSTSVLIQVGNTPNAVADVTVTMQNTPVSGNIGTNDSGTNAALNPTFTVTQPVSTTGTIAVNPSTGQYTFTPNPTFTGTFSTTYTLCNILPPCSNTTITFTVFPTLAANPNTVATTPSVSTTGNLLTNDNGIVAGATYSTSITQPAATTGTFVLNPATGQYTFNPNPAFTGTASTTYTVCNTAVTPSVCSSTSVLIQVGSAPVAVADVTTTPINTPVSGNIGTNDGGVIAALNPTFTVTQPSNGTVTINPSTGQYTFTPAPGFTGTTQATYTLCNIASPPCSNTTITFTVFPNVVANSNTVLTAPNTPTVGNLVTNDIIPAGITISVTVTQPAATTGTITVNPATGQFTFTPNPTFTGTTVTTYTVCNTSVNPPQCSNTTVTLTVGNTPNAVADATVTMQNTPVSGNIGTNDSGTNAALNPTFTVTQPPTTTGTIAVNPSTGQYTFTPNPTFTGTFSTTYTLCNSIPPCANTTITFTVFPTLTANPDVIATTPSVTTTGTLLTNDNGANAPGATYSVSVTQPASGVGTITINPSTGQYTFVPNPAFTGTSSTTYTVCNTAVTPSVCSTTSILIQVTNVPVAVSDGTMTLLNTPVSGNTGTNDSGASPSLNPTFTTSQPAVGTGTITMNPSTGQYTYTPAPGFTGTTQVTYTLCNVSSPPCSTANITFTVYPIIVAIDDVIATTPSVTVTGNINTNDGGLVPGGVYDNTVTPFPSNVGTITVNPATGQYTFVPNPTFTGTASTTYTICQYLPPSTLALQCSTASILVNVSNVPVAVNDGTVTLINVPVSGNVGTNDQGAGSSFTPTFTVGQPTAGTGTLNINPATGQYTFTPATGFTGTTVATYTLCNASGCATANVTFTVYPNLIAVNDVIPTTPSVTTTGSLNVNDIGLVPGGVYNNTVAPFPANVGTITVNPATGQYTFVPNPAFTGTASTTYTICQFVPPSTLALQCSTASILVNVTNAPIAVNDNTITVVNTPVSGNVSTNDVNASGGTFTFGSLTPNTGSIATNSTTGQYTFTPAPGFTGTTQITYTLCAGSPVTCTTAVLTITIAPQLIAVNDVVTTNINVPASGTLLNNDIGVVPGFSYTTTVTQPSPSVGVIVWNPTTGQYTFTPAPGFTGTAQTTYTICQYVASSSVALQCSTATITIQVGSFPSIGVAKAISSTTYNNDGSVSLTYKLVAKNHGNVALSNVTVVDDLSQTFPAPSTFTVVNSPSLITSAGSQIALNSSYSGTGSNTVITIPATSSLAIGRTDTITFTVRVNPNGFVGSYNNTATISANAGTVTISDVSVNGLNPDLNNDGNPTNDNSPTTFSVTPVKVGLAKSASKAKSDGNGNYDVTFKFTVKNYGAAPIYNVQITDNLANTFPSPATFSVSGAPVSINSLLNVNTGFTGTGTNTNVLANVSGSLAAGQTDTIRVDVKFTPNGLKTFSNTATASASSLPNGGFVGSDVSHSGTNPDPNGNNNPNDSNENDVTVFTLDGDLFVPQGFSPNGDGVNDVLVIRGLDAFPDNKFTILNRWGNVVYKADGYKNDWNGKATEGVKFGGDDLPEGTYFYILDLGNDEKPMKGYIFLNRAAK